MFINMDNPLQKHAKQYQQNSWENRNKISLLWIGKHIFCWLINHNKSITIHQKAAEIYKPKQKFSPEIIPDLFIFNHIISKLARI